MPHFPPSPDAARLDLYQKVRNLAAFNAVSMVDWANHKPENRGQKPKIGGHQASSLSSVDLLSALYLHFKRPQDRIAVKPHAAPVLYSLAYLMGLLPEEQMGRLREFGGPQPYPTKLKDPVLVDYTTSSEALGVCATIYDAYGARWQNDNAQRLRARVVDAVYYAHCGDGELTEGQIDESLYDAGRWKLDNLIWIVDLNLQSLDRVMDDSGRLEDWAAAKFLANGWHVVRLRWGSKLLALFEDQPEGPVLQERLESLDDAQFQSLLLAEPAVARRLLCGHVADARSEIQALEQLFADEAPMRPDDARALAKLLGTISDAELMTLLRQTGGHDLGQLVHAFEEAQSVEGQPVCILARTVKGYGSAIAAHPENHGMLMDEAQVEQLRHDLGVGAGRFPRPAAGSPEAEWLKTRAAQCFDLAKEPVASPVSLDFSELSSGARAKQSTGEAFQSLNLALLRSTAGPYLAFGAPDVGQTTHLGPVIRQTGVYSPHQRPDYFAWLTARRQSAFAWRSEASGQFHSLGIAEGNAMLWAYAFGRRRRPAEGKVPLLTVVTVYDKFFERAINQLDYACYSDARFVAVGVPSGTGLSRETGTHQSVSTPRMLMDMPGIIAYEPAFAEDVRAIYLWALGQLWNEDGEAVYLRLTTQPLDNIELPDDAAQGAIAGAYWVRHPRYEGGEGVHLFATGRKLAQALEAADRLAQQGIWASVLNVTSYERLWREWDHWRSHPELWEQPGATYHLAGLIPDAELNLPLLITGDFSPSVCDWVSSALGRLGDHRFLGPRHNSQAGALAEVDRYHGMATEDLVDAALAELAWRRRARGV